MKPPTSVLLNKMNPLMANLIDQTSLFFLDTNYQCFTKWAEQNKYERGPRGHYLEQAHYDYVYEHLGPWVKQTFYSS